MAFDEVKLRAWVEQTTGGTITRWAKQDRWRESWLAEVDKDGERLPLYVRGDRGEEFPEDPLEYEAAMIRVLGAQGIPVPKIYGVCPDPHALLMEASPGRANLATATDEAERLAVLDHLAEIMAAMHALDVEPFVAAGARLPTTPEQVAMPWLQACERFFRRHKSVPDPRIEFLLRWAYANVPEQAERVTFLHADPAQFLFDNGRVTAMLDFEMACLGDPMMDIAATRQRALAEPMGDLRPWLRRYVERTGVTLDRQRITFHTAQYVGASSILMAEAVRHPTLDSGYTDYLSWYLGCLVSALQAIAEHGSFELSPPPEPPQPRPSRWAPAYDVLAERFRKPELVGFERTLGTALTTFLRQTDALGAWADEEYLNDVGEILGSQPADWQEADALLDAYVVDGKGEDADLVRLFHRWVNRQLLLIHGTFEYGVGSMQPIDELMEAGGPGKEGAAR